MTDAGEQALRAALEAMGDQPGDLATFLKLHAAHLGVPSKDATLAAIGKALRSKQRAPLLFFHEALTNWDYIAAAPWVKGTPRCTVARRDVVYDLLGLPRAVRLSCDARFPVEELPTATVIADKPEVWKPVPGFYWKAYRRYLLTQNGWHKNSVAILNDVTQTILSKLSNPTQTIPYPSRGLVVGYVQSGKTANFIGLIARAIDAGYRLIIVLGGALDVLRNQTQRRIDKQLVGQELLRQDPEGNEYASDEEWSAFQSYGGPPSARGAVDIVRLTGRETDYRRLGKSVAALEFGRRESRLPLNDVRNLAATPVRLIVAKKNAAIIRRIAADLQALVKTQLANVPALIIDDESDQGSINVYRPPKQSTERRAVNKALTDLRGSLRRAQYVGYTATPFANVFVNPEDTHDIFPADFIVSLPPPLGYMGVAKFFDPVVDVPRNDPAQSNEAAFVRPVVGHDKDPKNFQRALDSFVLAGAVKLYRTAKDRSLAFRHHTMLVHHSTLRSSHDATAQRVEKVLEKSGYGFAASDARLGLLFEDFRAVSAARAPDLPCPRSFNEVRRYVRECYARIQSDKAVRIVNGENIEDTPDFDRQPVWSVLVGGAKLSRGYTIEGLTVSYFRRTSSTADTLMQMGRWFGFRGGYGDLCRLFIGRDEPLGKKGKRRLNLLEAFRALCLDEEEFRAELQKYADDESITPKDVPPLVPFHMLRPTAANKMRWADLEYQNLGGSWREKTSAPRETKSIRANETAMKDLLKGVRLHPEVLNAIIDGERVEFDAICGEVECGPMRQFLSSYQWAKGQQECLTRELRYLAGRGSDDPLIDRWIVIAPQLRTDARAKWGRFDVKQRSRVTEKGDRYKVYSESHHVDMARYLAGVRDDVSASRTTQQLRRPRTGVMLFYPVRDFDNKEKYTSMGFGLMFPPNPNTAKLRYVVNPRKAAGRNR